MSYPAISLPIPTQILLPLLHRSLRKQHGISQIYEGKLTIFRVQGGRCFECQKLRGCTVRLKTEGLRNALQLGFRGRTITGRSPEAITATVSVTNASIRSAISISKKHGSSHRSPRIKKNASNHKTETLLKMQLRSRPLLSRHVQNRGTTSKITLSLALWPCSSSLIARCSVRREGMGLRRSYRCVFASEQNSDDRGCSGSLNRIRREDIPFNSDSERDFESFECIKKRILKNEMIFARLMKPARNLMIAMVVVGMTCFTFPQTSNAFNESAIDPFCSRGFVI